MDFFFLSNKWILWWIVVGFMVVDRWLIVTEFVMVDRGWWQIGGGCAVSGLGLNRGRR